MTPLDIFSAGFWATLGWALATAVAFAVFLGIFSVVDRVAFWFEVFRRR